MLGNVWNLCWKCPSKKSHGFRPKKTLKHFNPRGGSDMEVSMGLPTARWMVYYPVVDVYITMENHNF